jgi:hypothetical protein
MRYQHPNLEEITIFLQGKYLYLSISKHSIDLDSDFGMTIAKQTDDEIWYRGYGVDPYVYYAKKGPKQFLGGAFEVESYQDLERLVAPAVYW